MDSVMTEEMPAKLRSTNPAEVAEVLGALLVEEYKAKPIDRQALQGGEPDHSYESRTRQYQQTLEKLRELSRNAHNTPETQAQLRKDIVQTLRNYEYPEIAATFYAQLGHLNEIAQLVARDNIFHELHKAGLPAPSGVGDLIGQRDVFKSASIAVENLNKPTLGLTFTGHPTNTNSLESMKAQRALTRALDDLRRDKGDVATVRDALKTFADAPLLPTNDKGEPAALTVAQETEQMLYHFGTLWDDLPKIYKRFDEPLAKRFGPDSKEPYDPATLTLPIDLSSWGSSGDKDGNKNVNANTTLLAMAQHKREAATRYLATLEELQSPALDAWKDKLSNLSTVASTAIEGYKAFSPEEFQQHAASLKAASVGLDKDAFLSDIRHAYASETNEEKKHELLTLERRVEIFGFNFGRIEYRETAEEYTRIAGLFIEGYEQMDEAARQQALTGLLQQSPLELRQHFQNVIQALDASAGKPYSDSDVGPIAYHTLKRMELARDFPDMVTDNVLAECQNTSNFLEALLMQKLSGDAQGKTARLGIVPLFEEYGVLERVGDILKDAFGNEAYKTHLNALKERNGGSETQQVQLAHSDNARRAGMPAARAYIYEAHETIRNACKEAGITPQFFEGGSQSDPYRGGVRAMSASVNEFGIHDFAKFTFQGGDLLNYLNYSGSIVRTITRAIAHRAEALYNVVTGKDPKKNVDPALDKAATQALKATVRDYEDRVFNNPDFGVFLEEQGYLEEAAAGGFSSRTAARGSSAGGVNVHKTRTIAFSEAFQHAGICPTWIGAQNLYTYLCRETGEALTPEKLNDIYKKSPVFADAIDRILFGVAMTDMDALGNTHQGQTKHSLMYQTLCTEYRHAFRVAMEAKTGQRFASLEINQPEKSFGGKSLGELRQIATEQGLPELAPAIASKRHYMEMVDTMRDIMAPTRAGADKEQYKPIQEEKTLRSILHNAGDTALHSRFLMADDPATAQFVKHLKAANDNVTIPAENKMHKAHEAYMAERNGGKEPGRAA